MSTILHPALSWSALHLSDWLPLQELPIRYAQRILQIEALPEWQASRELVEALKLSWFEFSHRRLTTHVVLSSKEEKERIGCFFFGTEASV